MHVRPVPCDAHTSADNASLPVALSTFAQTFEMAVSQFVKTTWMVVVLHTVLDLLADEEAKDLEGNELDKKNYLFTAMTSAQRAERQLAITPDMMHAILKSLAFTNNADVAMVQMIYRKTFEAVVTKARILGFPAMPWITKEQWGQFFSGVLSQCTHLEELILEQNPTLEEGIVELVEKLPPTLKLLILGNTGCFGDGGKADWSRLPALEVVILYGTKVSGSKEKLRAAGCKAWDIRI